MRLNNLQTPVGSRHSKKRVGIGPGSGHGKTSCRGHKGSLARSGGRKSPGFEGGQMPLIRRTPKRGFRNVFQKFNYTEVNLDTLDKLTVDTIDIQVLIDCGVIKKQTKKVKILGNGELRRKITVVADAFSTAAQEKIKAAGGEAKLRS